MQLLGPSQFWRIEDSAGYENRLAWTNAISSDEQSNWARWQIVLSEAGRYKVEIFADAGYSEHTDTRYELRLATGTMEFSVDQSQLDGWHELGEFDFSVGGGQELRLFDNSSGAVADGTRISADAIRLTRVVGDGPDGPDEPDGPDGPDGPDKPGDSGGLSSGCSSSGTSGGSSRNSLFPVLLLALVGILRRRKHLKPATKTRR